MTNTPITPETESDIFTRLIGAAESPLPPPVAESMLQWQFTENDQERMHYLLSRNNEGESTVAEAEELRRYGIVGRLLNVIHARARASLRKTA